MKTYKKYVLDNGLTVLINKVDNYQSCSVGLWVKYGSMYENTETNGIAHFIEHMLFKDTEHIDSKTLTNMIEKTGGEINAFTSREFTCFFTKTLAKYIEDSFKVLSEMIKNPTFKMADIDKEKKIILEEYRMYQDTPEELVYDQLIKLFYENDEGISFPVIGSKANITNFSRDLILSVFEQYYVSNNMVLSICSPLEENDILALVDQYFADIQTGQQNQSLEVLPVGHYNWACLNRPIEQVQMEIGFKGFSYNHKSSYVLMLINNLLTGSNNSRLFYAVREEHGLAYSIQSSPVFYDHSGFISINVAIDKDNMEDVLKLILEELLKIKETGFTSEEIEDNKMQLIGSTILGMESTDSIMDFNSRIELHESKEKSVQALVEILDLIDEKTINKVVNEILNDFNLSIVGNVSEKDVEFLYNKYRDFLLK